jgi:iron complex outermembrane receptor protein
MYMYLKKWLLTAMVVCFLGLLAIGQQQSCSLSLKGTVSFGDSVITGLNAVSVIAKQTKQQATADSAGNFIITNVCPGKLGITISYIGYRTIDTTVDIEKDTSISFMLASLTQRLTDVTVTAELIHKDQITTAVKSTLSGLALEQTRGLSLGESLKSIVGMNSLQTGPSISKPVIHGVYSNRILIVNNGVRQEGQNWGNDHAPEIDPFIATKITVIKGAGSIRYGSDAIGGVVLIEPKDLRIEPGMDGNVNIVGMTNGRIGVASGMLEGAAANKLQGLSFRVQGTLKKGGNAEAPTYYLGNTGYYEDDYSATLQYAKSNYGVSAYYSKFDTKIGIALASHIGTLADLSEAFARSEPADTAHFTYDISRPYQTVNHELIKASAFLNLGNNMGRIDAVYARQKDIRKEYDADVSFNDSLARLNPPDLYFKLVTHTVDLIWQHPSIKNKILGSIGINFITHGNLQQGTGYQELIPNFVDYGGGIFVIEKYEIGKLLVEGGLRYDYRWLQAYTLNSTTLVESRPTYSWSNITTNAGATYKFNNDFSAVYNFGSAWRPPQVIELFANGIHQSAASYEHGDTALTLEKAYNNNLAFSYHHKNLEAEIGFYVNYFHHYIYLKPDSVPVETIQGAFPSFTYTQVNALFKGIDFNVEYTFFKHFSLISKTSVLRARNLTIDNWLIGVPADRTDNSIRYQFDSKGKEKKIYIGITNLAVAKQSRVPPNSDYVPPPAGYDLWGAELGCSIPFLKNQMDVSITVSNLTNVSYRDYLDRFRYFINEPGRNITLRLLAPF